METDYETLKDAQQDAETLNTTQSQIDTLLEGNRFSLLQNINSENDLKESSVLDEIRKKNELQRNHKKRIFEVINNQESLNVLQSKNITKTRKTQEYENQTSQPILTDETQGSIKKRERPPPINILRQDPRDTAKLIEENLKTKDFYIKRIHSGKHVLYLQGVTDFNNAKTLLCEAKTSFYTYTPKIDRPQTLLIKGLSNTFGSEEILQELKEKNIQDVQFLKVSEFKTKSSIQKSISLPIFLVQVSPTSKISNVFKIKFISYQSVRWEKLKRTEIIQCFNCQAIGHTARNCFMDYRCVKCIENHEPGMCKIKKDEKIENDKLY